MPVDALPADPSNETIAGWDSLHHLELMLALEMEFGVQLSSDVMPTLLSADAIEDCLREQGALA